MANHAPSMTPQERTLAVQIVDALQAVFGVHPGFRAVHAKGIVCVGSFRPSAGAASVCRAPHFEGAPTPVTLRFSDFPGTPVVNDGEPGAGPRGMAIKFHLASGTPTDIVAHSHNGFPVATAVEMLAFAHALAASGPGATRPTPIESFAEAHPAAKRFLEAPKPTPASFAAENYFGVHAFRFTNRQGVTRHGRISIVPAAGTIYLDPGDAAARSANFLFDELATRLGRGPVEFRLKLQLPAAGDPVNDASQIWPEDRPQIELGVLSVTGVDPDSKSAERQLIFDPTRLCDGIELSADPLPLARAHAYAISYERRNP